MTTGCVIEVKLSRTVALSAFICDCHSSERNWGEGLKWFQWISTFIYWCCSRLSWFALCLPGFYMMYVHNLCSHWSASICPILINRIQSFLVWLYTDKKPFSVITNWNGRTESNCFYYMPKALNADHMKASFVNVSIRGDLEMEGTTCKSWFRNWYFISFLIAYLHARIRHTSAKPFVIWTFLFISSAWEKVGSAESICQIAVFRFSQSLSRTPGCRCRSLLILWCKTHLSLLVDDYRQAW